MGGGAPELWSEPSVFGDRAVFRDFKGQQQAVLTVSAVTMKVCYCFCETC